MNKNLALIYLLLFCNFSFAQNIYSGFITSSENNKPIKGVEIYNKVGGELSQTDKNGFFKFNSSEKDLTIILFARNFLLIFSFSFPKAIFSKKESSLKNILCGT